MKKHSPPRSSRQRIARALQGLRKTPQGGLILDERSVEEDIYATAKPAASKKSKERKTA
jgi:hypothetical protein